MIYYVENYIMNLLPTSFMSKRLLVLTALLKRQVTLSRQRAPYEGRFENNGHN
jgi:hypothetical protein